MISVLFGLALAAEPVVELPRLVREPKQLVPAELQQHQGNLLLELTLDETGKPYAVTVLEGIHPELDAHLQDRALLLRFTPALSDEEAVPSTIQWSWVVSGEESDEEADLELIVVAEEPWRQYARSTGASPEGATPGEYELTRRDIELTANSTGDPLRAVVDLPGVTRTNLRYGNQLYVRGGDRDETIWLLDGIPIERARGLSVLSIFNPTLVERMSLHSTAPPAIYPEAVSGAVAADYVFPRDSQWDGTVELTLLHTSLQVGGPIGDKGLSFVAAGRAATLAPWLFMVTEAGFFGSQPPLYDIQYYDGFARLGWDIGELGVHRLSLTGLGVVDLNGIETDTYANHADERLALGSLRYEFTPSDRIRWDTSLSMTADQTTYTRSEGDGYATNRLRPFLRSQLDLSPVAGHTVRAGVDAALYDVDHEGPLLDYRWAPPWTNGGLGGRTGLDPVDIDVEQGWAELGVFVEHEALDLGGLPLDTRIGLRMTPVHNGSDVLLSPRAALGWELPTATTLRVYGGIAHQLVRDVYHLDSTIGAVEATPARSYNASVALEQAIGPFTVVRLEGWGRRYENLMVWGDDDAVVFAEDFRFEALGTGESLGVDLYAVHRQERWGTSLAYSFQHNRRTNPLVTLGEQTIEPAWSVPHSITAKGDVQLGSRRKWTVSGSVLWQWGYPYSRAAMAWDPAIEAWRSDYYEYNSLRGGPQLAFAFRVEHRTVAFKGKVKLSVFLDLLNLRVDGSSMATQYRGGSYDPLVVPYGGSYPGLPPLPWLGLRAEF